MKKQEALDLVRDQMAAGKTKQEITGVLLSQDKIGSAKPTQAIIDLLFAEAEKEPEVPKEESGANYEKWIVSFDGDGNPVRREKLKDVSITEKTANNLNAAKMQSKDGFIMYFKK